MPLVFSYGPEEIERVAVLTGGAARYVEQAAAEGYHCFVTGEADEPTKRTPRRRPASTSSRAATTRRRR